MLMFSAMKMAPQAIYRTQDTNLERRIVELTGEVTHQIQFPVDNELGG